MNCLEFRRALAATPARTDAAFLSHRDGCSGCGDAWAQAMAFERTLERALAVPVPEGLADRILLHQTTRERRERTVPRWAAWRIAAGVVLALGAAAALQRAFVADAPLAQLALDHLSHEPHALAARADVAAPRIASAFRRAGSALAGEPARVDYVQNCELGGRDTVHMVVQRPEGPVTVMYVAEGGAEPAGRFERHGMKGRQVPLAGGTLVLLAAEERSFDALESEWRRAIAGSADVAFASP